ncbi:MAG: SRPBCC domain-containing protein [Bacteroidota bacterium]
MKEKDSGFSIEMNYVIYASPEKVFEALTDTGIIAAWGGGIGVVENKPGGKFELFDGWASGEVLVYKPGKELSYTWRPSEWDKKTPSSTASFLFKTHAAGTEIILNHTQFPSVQEATKHKDGWIDFVFEPLNEYFTA